MVASEFARCRGKRRSAVLLAAVGLSMSLSSAAGAQTLPGGGSVIRGQASLSQSGSHLQVTQTSKNAVVNWNDFSIGSGASVFFANGSGATLNRVTGSLPSSINGRLSATGSLYLVNRNGVIVGSEGVINAAGFTATTLDIRDDEFMAGGGLRLFGDSRAGIVNLGSIHADSGDVTLVAHSVRNDGAITAPHGAAELLAGQELFLASPDTPALLVSLGQGAASTGETGVTNNGLIEAAQARMQAADGNLYALAINQSGVIRATGVSTGQGRIVLTADGGTVLQNGKLSAHNANGSGGDILVGGDYQGGNVAVANATSTLVTGNAEMDASATAAQGDGGRVIVWADEDTHFAGSIKARGGDKGGNGGFVEVSGKHALDFRPSQPIDLSAKAGKAGTVLLDPDEIEVVTTVGGPNQIAVSVIEAGLASANYVLNTSNFDPFNGSGNITISNDLNWTSTSTLTLKSGNRIDINANITGLNGALELYAGRYAEPALEAELGYVNGGAMLATGKTIAVNRLRYGANADSLPAGYTLDPDWGTDSFWVGGKLRALLLELDLSAGSAGIEAENSGNIIGAFSTSGSYQNGHVSLVNSTNMILLLNATGGAGSDMSFVTQGSLLLGYGSRLSSTAQRDIVLASIGGEFINQAGADAFGGNLRYLIYANSRTGTDKGGLAGTEEYTRTYAGNPPEDYDGDRTSRFLFAQPAPVRELTYTANDLTRLYGGANPAFSYSVSGLLQGDILENVASGSPLLSTSATMHSGVGGYTIDISQGTLSSSDYSFLFVPGTLSVTPAPLTYRANDQGRLYGGANPAFTYYYAGGLLNGDVLGDVVTGAPVLSSSATLRSGERPVFQP